MFFLSNERSTNVARVSRDAVEPLKVFVKILATPLRKLRSIQRHAEMVPLENNV